MSHLVSLIAHHGYLVVFAVVLAEAIGLPVPAAPALVAAGAAVASGVLSGPLVLVYAIVAMLLGDLLLYFLGRHTGWALLSFLCKVSVNPESCILRSAESFYKRGRTTLVVAKFIPGINTMAPPLAGSMKMRLVPFLEFDLLGAVLYALAFGTLGFLFRDFLVTLARGFEAAGRAVETALVFAAVMYLIYRVSVYRKNLTYKVVPRVTVDDVAKRLTSEGSAEILVLDARSHGYYDSTAERIRGSRRLEPNNLLEELKSIPKDKDIFVYCT